MQVIPFYCVFISNGALFWDDVKKFVSGLIIMGIWQVERLLRWGLGVVPVIIYHWKLQKRESKHLKPEKPEIQATLIYIKVVHAKVACTSGPIFKARQIIHCRVAATLRRPQINHDSCLRMGYNFEGYPIFSSYDIEINNKPISIVIWIANNL